MTTAATRIAPQRTVQPLPIDVDAMLATLVELLEMPSPTGYTDSIVRLVCARLDALEIKFEITRRGGIRANLPGRKTSPDRAVVSHVDTLGAQVTDLKPNGRLSITPIGTWSARFAEGARVTILKDHGHERGTILPLKASGHVYNEEIDTQPVSWENLEIRVDAEVADAEALRRTGFNIGDIVAVDTAPEIGPNGFINARHLDDKAGVAAMLAALTALVECHPPLPVECHFLFTISEEVGSGASSILHGDVSELVAVDNGTVAPTQSSRETGVTIAMADQTGPFDYHLTRLLIGLAEDAGIPHQRDMFRYYRCDAASALAAGNDIRTALMTFGVDASHGYERTHKDALESVAQLITCYVQSQPVSDRDAVDLGSIEGFTEQPV